MPGQWMRLYLHVLIIICVILGLLSWHPRAQVQANLQNQDGVGVGQGVLYTSAHLSREGTILAGDRINVGAWEARQELYSQLRVEGSPLGEDTERYVAEDNHVSQLQSDLGSAEDERPKSIEVPERREVTSRGDRVETPRVETPIPLPVSTMEAPTSTPTPKRVETPTPLPTPKVEVPTPTPTKEAPKTTAADSSSLGDEIANIALRYLGYRYAMGGASPAGFDCSGFAQYVYRQVGISLPRDTGSQLQAGERVTALAVGDLVFFTNTYQPGLSHVGIYLGGNKFIHAATESRGVSTDYLTSAYWSVRYYGARRPW